MADSYDLLARSIERVIRGGLPPRGAEQQLASAIDRAMTAESRAGELRLAWLRLLVAAAFVIVTLGGLAWRGTGGDGEPGGVTGAGLAAGVATLWFLIAAGLTLALRQGWYQRWVPHVMPGVDAAMIATGILAPLLVASPMPRAGPEGGATLTALCAFLAFSGGLRLSRTSARVGTVLAIVVFAAGAIVAHLAIVPVLAVVAMLAGTGVVGASSTQLVRRLVTDEVTQATLSTMYNDAALAIDAREQVLRIVAHDLRNPLSTVAMAAELLIEAELPPERRREHLHRIRRAGENMNRLVQDLLDAAKFEAGRVAIAPTEVDVDALLHDAREQLAPIAAARALELEMHVEERLPRVSADAGRVLQVLSNLVGNACKFTLAGGRIRITARAAPGGVHFSVADTGCGIPPDQLDRVFGGFWQADAADRRGIGLGLTIAKAIVDAHAGRLWVESTVGEGTTFHFVLGRASPAQGSPSAQRGGVAAVG